MGKKRDSLSGNWLCSYPFVNENNKKITLTKLLTKSKLLFFNNWLGFSLDWQNHVNSINASVLEKNAYKSSLASAYVWFVAFSFAKRFATSCTHTRIIKNLIMALLRGVHSNTRLNCNVWPAITLVCLTWLSVPVLLQHKMVKSSLKYDAMELTLNQCPARGRRCNHSPQILDRNYWSVEQRWP